MGSDVDSAFYPSDVGKRMTQIVEGNNANNGYIVSFPESAVKHYGAEYKPECSC